jgi:hypothetical protein
MWGGFALFWEHGVTGDVGRGHASPDAFFTLWGIPFVVIGQYMIWGRFFYIAWRKSRTYYAVTSKRVLVVSQTTRRKIIAGYLPSLDGITLSLRSDGIGTIEFSPQPETIRSFFSNNRRGAPSLDIDLNRLVFYDILDARNVYQLLQDRRNIAEK